MQVKAFEIRDAGTFIPAMAILMEPGPASVEAESFLLRRAGFAPTWCSEEKNIILCRMEAKGNKHDASYDPYGWGCARTMQVAHQFIAEHWNSLPSGAVVCVESICGERETPKESERISNGKTS